MADDFIVSDEDKALFRNNMQTVKRLKQTTKCVKTAKVLPAFKPRKSKPEEPVEKKEYYLSDVIIDTVFSETILAYSHPSIPSQRFKALKKGHIYWEARLDLHGLKSDEARETLYHFINHQKQQGKNCLLIIHGKGSHLVGEPPVIKNLLNRWLPQFDEVLGFHSALPQDGGSGAVYVLLKRKR